MKLKKCKECKKYTLKEVCETCKEKTSEAHYKFIKFQD
ncbi:hypothetical protein COT60_00200 [Candidatus Pacearchaeota archaeon CG09_land_8_20_14_0_10_30_9]|nr:hypothetical protein [Candidatus Pacearchaeota archaeon]PIN71546.1 MAG: hypothetical protein COV77_01450 [Candidatus Pacearchaeota archaeon CG11_big_fil_rev_8_21_14_0_20_30_13]PIO01496.1 MAG: hypothetical protein COT60_00200 [Candidatus Pacearchaeota archaeon CG09_land_8_20_14_0_10_30_9]PIZ81744.1 MAG: hypothetical protein COX98_02695 [Candidatus Pacearchaeota archaeon CG_4_10_14_0_2_um_filter_30_11]PJA71625.1 MAG: hypothetical protein CO153_00600 [Candidatus Pacearchaeota archaeon CG_4_9_14